MNDKTPALIEVTLLKPHTHAGKPRGAGEKISVTESQRDWLRAKKIIAGAPASRAPVSAPAADKDISK